MDWVALDEEALGHFLSKAELSSVKLASKQADISDLVATTLSKVAAEVRAAAAVKFQVSGTAGEVPPEAEDHALAIAVFRALTRLNLKVSDERKELYKEATRWLRDLAAGKVAISAPAIADTTVSQPVGLPLGSGNTRVFTRSTQDGI